VANTKVKPPIPLDTGVISRIIRGKLAFVVAYNELAKTRTVFITFVTRLELYEWMRLNRKSSGERAYRIGWQAIEAFPLLPHTPAVTAQALALGQHLPHIGVPDYINAATALVAKCPLFTLNRKHFLRTKVKLYEPPGFDFAEEGSR
jgi:predicted nucleic acid-binding protein